MSDEIVIHRNRTTVLSVALGEDVSDVTLTAEIRKERDPESDLVGAFEVTNVTDGTDGEIVLTFAQNLATDVPYTYAWMDIKKVVETKAYSVFIEPQRVFFQGVVTQ